jgi:predicted RecA/RadA family phage recombinase
MSNPGLTKNYLAEGAIGAMLFVKPGAADYGALVAAAGTDKVIGIATDIAAAAGDRVDVIHEGIADLILGGTVARGDLLMSDAAGKGVVAAAAAGSNVRVGAMALISGVSGDIIPVKVIQGSFQG